MNIDFLFPAWFLMAFPTAWVCYRFRSTDKIHNAIRVLFLAAILMALAQPRLCLSKRGGVVVVVADRSSSLHQEDHKRQVEIIKLIEKQRGERDRIAVVGFAEDTFIEKFPDFSPFGEFLGNYRNKGSRIADAVSLAKSLIPSDRHGKIVILSDGLYTSSSPLGIAGLAAPPPVPADYRLMQRPPGKDLAVMGFSTPDHVETGESFIFSATVLVPSATTVSLQLSRGNTIISSASVQLEEGVRKLFFRDRITSAGNSRYKLQISSTEDDPVPENNSASAVIYARGSKPILHVGNPDSNLLRLARGAGIELHNSPPLQMDWSLEALSAFNAVVMENVSASEIGHAGQESLLHFVRDLGGGLMLTGGRKSFGMGGFYGGPVEELLPVSLELRREHRKFSTAVVVALDRSGSMTMPVHGGLTKMDLANQGTATVLQLMSENDYLGVVAVDSVAHVVQDIQRVSGNRVQMEHRIRGIKSMGGGIFVYEALKKAASMIQGVSAGSRHIILFSDAQDSEQPGGYKDLVSKLHAAGITVSVIGLGKDSDCDSALLVDIAKIGGGNIYFTEAAKDLPQLFAMDTMAVMKSAFIQEATNIRLTEDFQMLAQLPPEQPPPIGGYNIAYLKPGASAAIVTDDGQNVPILSFRNTGSGRCIAFCAEADGKHSGKFAEWRHSGEILLSAIRWINKPQQDDDLVFVHGRNVGGDVHVFAELDPLRDADPFSKLPEVVHLVESEDGIRKHTEPMMWYGRDQLLAKIPVPASGTSHFFVQYRQAGAENDPGLKTIQCSSFCLPYPLEFLPETSQDRGSKMLARLADATSGRERMSFDGIFDDIPPFRRFIPAWHLLALVALAMLMAEVVYRRLLQGAISSRRSARKAANKTADYRKAPQPPPPDPDTKPDSNAQASGSVLGAISKAREKTRGRIKN